MLEKLRVTQLVEKFSVLWNPKVHQCSQGPATGPYPETYELNLHLPTLFPSDAF